MQVILFRNIERLGMQGDVVNVANGYYRNYLGPQGFAVEANDASLRRLDLKRKKLQVEAEKQRGEAQDMAKRLSGVTLTFVRKATDNQKLFGSVTEHDVVDKLAEAGFEFERRHVEIREPIKTTGTHNLKLKLDSNLLVDVKVVVEREGGHSGDDDPYAAAPAAAAAAPAEAEAEQAADAEATEEPAAEADKPAKKSRKKKSDDAE